MSNYTEINGIKVPTLQLFTRTFSKSNGKADRRFIEKYGNVTFEEAYPLYLEMCFGVLGRAKKIDAFEKHLRNIGAKMQQSNISESRYYYLNGMKYRFSSHVYPTGSMTSEMCIDFAANPEMIDTITF